MMRTETLTSTETATATDALAPHVIEPTRIDVDPLDPTGAYEPAVPAAPEGASYTDTPARRVRPPVLTMPASQMEEHMDALNADLTALEARYAAEQGRYQTALHNNADGSDPTPEHRAKTDRAFAHELYRHEYNIQDAARKLEHFCSGVQASTGDEPLTLAAEEMQAAESLRGYTQHLCADGKLKDVLAVLRHAIATEDKPALFALSRYVPARLAKAAPKDGTATPLHGVDAEVSSEIRTLLAEAKARLKDKSLSDLNKRAGLLRGRATTAAYKASKRRRREEPSRSELSYQQAIGEVGRPMVRFDPATGKPI